MRSQCFDPKIKQLYKGLQTPDGRDLWTCMVELFLLQAAEAQNTLPKLIAANDLDAVARTSHTLKSTSGNIGAMQASDLAGNIETEVRSGTTSVETVGDLVDQLLRDLRQAAEALQEGGVSYGVSR